MDARIRELVRKAEQSGDPLDVQTAAQRELERRVREKQAEGYAPAGSK